MRTRYILILTLCFLLFSIEGVCQHFGRTESSTGTIFFDETGKAHYWGGDDGGWSNGFYNEGVIARTPVGVDSTRRWITGAKANYTGVLIGTDSMLYFTAGPALGDYYDLPDYFNDSTLYSPTPYPNPPGVTGWQSVSLCRGLTHIALTTDGKAYYWHKDKNTDLTLLEFPTNVKRWDEVVAGNNYYLLLSSDGRIYGFGDNENGQLGTGDRINKEKPTILSHPIGLGKWVKVTTGTFDGYSVGIDDKGRLFHWGYLYLADTVIFLEPVQYTSNEVWKDVKINLESTVIGLTTDGKIYMWGCRDSNLTGLNDGRRYLKEPVLLPFPEGVTAWKDISVSHLASFAVDQNCNVWGWGYNTYHDNSIGLPLDSGFLFTTPRIIKSFCQQSDVPRYKNEQNFTDMRIYPNPASKSMTAEFVLTKDETIDVELRDVLGRKVQSFTHSQHQAGKRTITLDVSNLPTGKYILRIQAGQQTISRSIVVE
jgi:hypothetical protein